MGLARARDLPDPGRRRLLAGCGGAVALGLLRPWQALAQEGSSESRSELTFFVTADTHYGRFQKEDNSAGSKSTIAHMGAAAGRVRYPEFAGGGLVKAPKGVLVAGDLTDSARESEFFGDGALDGFAHDYPLDGGPRLGCPVYEGYGNHDYEINGVGHAARDAVRERNKSRKGLTAVSANGYHYSWDWGDVHFVNLNLFPGRVDRKLGEGRVSQPLGSLDFLRDDLEQRVGKSKRPVVLCHHYGLDEDGLWWWDGSDRTEYHKLIKDYNIIGIFHGHSHQDMIYTWKGISVYNVNTALYGGWAIVRITPGEMFVGLRHWHEWSLLARKAIPL